MSKPTESELAPFKVHYEKVAKEVAAQIKTLVTEKGFDVVFITRGMGSGFNIVLKTDEEAACVTADAELLASISRLIDRSSLPEKIRLWHHAAYGYNAELASKLAYLLDREITFASQETVDRDYDGHWYHYYK